MKKITLVIVIILITAFATATLASSPPPKKYTPVSRSHSWKERSIDAGVMFTALWAGYYLGQPDTVALIQGEDWVDNIFEKGAVLWDGDEWYWNFAAHPWVGSEYYLYFRSRGYAPKWSFFGSVMTSTTFEILVETFSEPFSVNDFIITPVVGSAIGYGREKAAMRLLHSDNKFYRGVGHVMWLETMLWFFEDVEIMPVASLDGSVMGLSFAAIY